MFELIEGAEKYEIYQRQDGTFNYIKVKFSHEEQTPIKIWSTDEEIDMVELTIDDIQFIQGKMLELGYI